MRVIAGKHRGRVLAAFRGYDVRPTADRVKESLFQILSSKIANARVLDLFCGSGALGIECLSRGAQEVTFCDSSQESVALLKKNLALVKERGTILNCDFRACLTRVSGKFDLIFADPPYKFDYAQDILSGVAQGDLLQKGGLVIYESEREQPPAEGWFTADVRRYGRTVITMFGRTE